MDHLGRGNKGYFMPWNTNKKRQKLIYSTELRLKTYYFYAEISIE
jgi:hypothetical protein